MPTFPPSTSFWDVAGPPHAASLQLCRRDHKVALSPARLLGRSRRSPSCVCAPCSRVCPFLACAPLAHAWPPLSHEVTGRPLGREPCVDITHTHTESHTCAHTHSRTHMRTLPHREQTALAKAGPPTPAPSPPLSPTLIRRRGQGPGSTERDLRLSS